MHISGHHGQNFKTINLLESVPTMALSQNEVTQTVVTLQFKKNKKELAVEEGLLKCQRV
jgi:hypothetical protein